MRRLTRLSVLCWVSVVAGCGWMVVATGGCEKAGSVATYKTVAANIQAGRQAVAPTGEVVLPPAQATTVVNGRAYLTKLSGGGMMVLFPTWRGKGTNLRGYLCSSGPALAVGSSVSITVWPSPGFASPFGTTEVVVESVVEPGWYYVSRSLD